MEDSSPFPLMASPVRGGLGKQLWHKIVQKDVYD